MIKEYIALFEYEPDECAYSVIFPDLPGCYSYGRDYDEAVKMAREALSLYADGGEFMPQPRTLERIKAEWAEWPEWEMKYKFLTGKVVW
jgi:predicted RNase H-like HicB family nuclease